MVVLVFRQLSPILFFSQLPHLLVLDGREAESHD
jgi:hypothetical protein